MSIIRTGGLKEIGFVLQSDVESVAIPRDTNQKATVVLKSGKAWGVLDYLPETGQLALRKSEATSSVAYGYVLSAELDGVDEANMNFVDTLLKGKYLVRFTDSANDTWLMGNLNHTGKWTLSGGKVGKTMPEDNEMILLFSYLDRIPLRRT